MRLISLVLLSPFMLYFHDLDIRVLKGIYESRNPLFDSTFIVITDTAAVIAFGLPLVLIIIAWVKKNTILRRKALNILVAVAISAVVANLLKYTIDLPRPYEIYPFIQKLSSGGSPSFPSGHTADAFAFAVALGLVFPKWYFMIPALVWAGFVGYSRMCLGVHFPTDVLAGAMIGIASAYFYYRFEKRKALKLS